MKLIVESNNFLYYKNSEYKKFKIELNGTLIYNSENNISVTIDQESKIFFKQLNQLHSFCEEIRGKSKEEILYYILKNNIEKSNNLIKTIENFNEVSLNTFKSIFLLYHWLEIPLINQNESDIDKTLYNDFVIDWTFRPESQKDIYLIKKEYIKSDNFEYLNHLKKINLLSEFRIEPYIGQQLLAFFIPLNQPGVSKALFDFKDSNGVIRSSYSLWKSILKDRDTRISNWINNRF
ncbi:MULTISPECIES: hypothetical protein [unclassified Empedobacter]|uniref:hypothetical protein n=1 Tax=unclassified Empedobacter TaxID=2643773 RepID=UPI00244D1F88|nr:MULTISPECIES: hypothetical protein [unclassified Empedobacter]MDH2208591.1 hypothetical protein [Empedobacter sp. GD03644]